MKSLKFILVPILLLWSFNLFAGVAGIIENVTISNYVEELGPDNYDGHRVVTVVVGKYLGGEKIKVDRDQKIYFIDSNGEETPGGTLSVPLEEFIDDVTRAAIAFQIARNTGGTTQTLSHLGYIDMQDDGAYEIRLIR